MTLLIVVTELDSNIISRLDGGNKLRPVSCIDEAFRRSSALREIVHLAAGLHGLLQFCAPACIGRPRFATIIIKGGVARKKQRRTSLTHSRYHHCTRKDSENSLHVHFLFPFNWFLIAYYKNRVHTPTNERSHPSSRRRIAR